MTYITVKQLREFLQQLPEDYDNDVLLHKDTTSGKLSDDWLAAEASEVGFVRGDAVNGCRVKHPELIFTVHSWNNTGR